MSEPLQPVPVGEPSTDTSSEQAVEERRLGPRPNEEPDFLRDTRLKLQDPRQVIAERISNWIFVAVVAGIALVVLGGIVIANWPPGWGTGLIAGGLPVVLVVLAWFAQFWPAIAYRWCRYGASEEGLEIYRGVVWRSVVNVPRARIQHTDVVQGPLQRRFGLGKLVVYTAGTQHAAIELEGLSREEALALRDLLTTGEDEDGTI